MPLLCSELYEAERWHEDCRMWTPMTTLDNGQQIFIGDIVDIDSSEYLSGKVTKFVEVCLHVVKPNYAKCLSICLCTEEWVTSSSDSRDQI
jgi:hypothetical protein